LQGSTIYKQIDSHDLQAFDHCHKIPSIHISGSSIRFLFFPQSINQFNGVLEGFVIGKDGRIYTSWLPTVDWIRPWTNPIKIIYESPYQSFAGKPQQQQPSQPPGGPPLQPPPEFGRK
jgi:hypothetical protein